MKNLFTSNILLCDVTYLGSFSVIDLWEYLHLHKMTITPIYVTNISFYMKIKDFVLSKEHFSFVQNEKLLYFQYIALHYMNQYYYFVDNNISWMFA